AVVLFPLIGHALNLDPHTFGLFAGTAVNDTSSVVAAAGVFSTAALGFAVVVKLVRTLMIIPISIGLSVMEARRSTDGQPLTGRRIAKLVPWFLIGFVIVAIVNSTGVIPDAPREILVQASVFLIAMALAGIGLSTDIPALRRAGWRPLALGGMLWMLVTITALATIAVTAALRGCGAAGGDLRVGGGSPQHSPPEREFSSRTRERCPGQLRRLRVEITMTMMIAASSTTPRPMSSGHGAASASAGACVASDEAGAVVSTGAADSDVVAVGLGAASAAASENA